MPRLQVVLSCYLQHYWHDAEDASNHILTILGGQEYILALELDSAIRLWHETYGSTRGDRTVVAEYLVFPILTIV